MEDRVGKWALDVEELENSESDLVENKDEECALVEDEMERLRSSWRLVITYKIQDLGMDSDVQFFYYA